MQPSTRHSRILLLATTLSLSSAGGAFAQDVDGALERMRDLMSEQGVTIDWQDADIRGADATLTGVTAKAEGEAVPIGDIEVRGVSQETDGFRVDEIAMPSYVATEAGGTMTISDVSMSQVFLPNEGVDVAGAELFFYERAELGSAVFEMDGKDLFTLAGMVVEVSPPEDDAPLSFTGSAERFTADLTATDDAEARQTLQRLGYEQIAGSMELAGSWAPQDGRLRVSQYDLEIEDAGTLGITFDISGYTTEFIKALRETTARMEQGGDQSAQGLAMFGLLQQLNLIEMQVAFDDASMTRRILEFAAEDQGATPEQVADQTKAVLPLLLAQFNAPRLNQMIVEAAGQFLDDPQSLTIRAEPSTPVPFAMIVAAGMASPDALAEQLGLTVTAND